MCEEWACQIIFLNACFTVTLQKDKVKGSHVKISHIFLRNKMLLQSQIITHQIWFHGIIGVHSPPYYFRSPLDTKAPGPPLIYLVGL